MMNISTAIRFNEMVNSEPSIMRSLNAAVLYNDMFNKSSKHSSSNQHVSSHSSDLSQPAQHQTDKKIRKIVIVPDEYRCESICLSGKRCAKKRVDDQKYCTMHLKKHCPEMIENARPTIPVKVKDNKKRCTIM